MTEIAPTYYARNVELGDVSLKGLNFDIIPRNALGVYAVDNDNPLQYRYTNQDYVLFDIDTQSETEMLLTPRVRTAHSTATYLGCIVSADRQTLYWVNETRPIP